MDPIRKIRASCRDRFGVVPKAHFDAAVERAEVYRLLSALISYPTEDLTARIASGALNTQLEALLSNLGHVNGCRRIETSCTSSLGSEYLRLFELAGESQPCPLYGGLYAEDRHGAMEELLRFYRHFGLSTEHAETRDLPDSIATVLEFLSFLCDLESQSANLDEANTARRAQKDVLARHVTAWTSAILEGVDALKPAPVYQSALALLDSYCRCELKALN